MKRFWITMAHIGVIAAGTAASIMIPGAGIYIIPAMGTVNALLPSPMKPAVTKSSDE